MNETRRRFTMVMLVLAALAAGASAASAQAVKKSATVVLAGDDAVMGPLTAAWRDAFRDGLKDLGWVEGRNLRLEHRSATTVERRPDTAAEIVKLSPDVIVAAAPAAFAYGILTPDVASRQRYWSPIRNIPIVFAGVSDPVAAGMVQSLARPGGTMTGIGYLGIQLNPKRLQLLKEAFPTVVRVGALVPMNHPMRDAIVRDVETAADALGVKLQLVEIGVTDFEASLEQGFAAMARQGAQAVLGLQGPQFFRERKRIAELSVKHRLPGIFELAEYAESGCLMAYAPNTSDVWRYAATFVDRILKGARPADLPVEQARKLDLVVNLGAAKALGVTISPALLARADRVIP